MDDKKILELFLQRNENAIVNLKLTYGTKLYAVAKNILNDTRDAEETENDTYLAVWNGIPPATPNPLLAFVLKICRNLALKKYSLNTAKKRNSFYDVALSELENCIPDQNTTEHEFPVNELTAAIERFLDMQHTENRVMFVRRYWFSDSVKDLALMFSITEHNVTVRLSRIREKLKKYLQKEGVAI